MTLADRLLARRQDLLAALERLGPETAHIAALAAVETVLRLCQAPPDAAPGERAVVSDDGSRIMLTVYGAELVAAVELTPGRALGLAAELLAAAHRHITRSAALPSRAYTGSASVA